MGKFRKKPVVIEAWQTEHLIGLAAHGWSRMPDAVKTAYERGDVVFAPDHISIHTLEGTHRADLVDMVICGVKGELYPCKPDIFAATYDAA